MTPDDLRDARATLGEMWGKGRPLHAAELGRALGLQGRDPGVTVLRYESGKSTISGPVSGLIRHWLRGDPPIDGVP